MDVGGPAAGGGAVTWEKLGSFLLKLNTSLPYDSANPCAHVAKTNKKLSPPWSWLMSVHDSHVAGTTLMSAG